MKSILYLLPFLLLVASCEEDNQPIGNPQTPPITQPPQPNQAPGFSANGYSVTEFIEGGTNKTQSVSNYRFYFQPSNTLLVTNGNESFNGTYLFFTDDGQLELRITLQANNILNEFNDDWYVLQKTASLIEGEDNGDRVAFQQ